MKILALCDSPTSRPGEAMTGFGRVAKNLFTQWTAAGAEIDVWAIHFDGWGYRDVPWRLFPAGSADWNSVPRLNAFLHQLATGGYTHCWVLMDLDALCISDFPKKFRAECKKRNIRSMIYFPVDAAQNPKWMASMAMVDVAVTYTDYGRDEALNAAMEWKKEIPESPIMPRLHVLPHGLEPHYVSPGTPRRDLREQFVVDERSYIEEGDFLILNVNTNSWRKDPLRTLEIVKGLRNLGVPAKLVLRMTPFSRVGGIDLVSAGEQLGLKLHKDFTLLPALPEDAMPKLYHAADLYLTTTLGEGWGLGITEALGCGCPVALPDNTACSDIGLRILGTDNANLLFLGSEIGYVCGTDSRLRQRVDLTEAIGKIEKLYRDGDWKRRHSLSPQTREWLSWPRIAAEMLKLMKGDL